MPWIAPAIIAAGTLGSAAISTFGAGSSGGGGNTFNPSFAGTKTQTPGFQLRSGFNPGANNPADAFKTSLTRRGTAPQLAFNERFPRILGDIDTLRGGLTPGFSQLRAARLRRVENARTRAQGDIRESLGRRRVLGSSFAENAQIRAEREFAELEAEQEGISFLEELNANVGLLQFEGANIEAALQRELQELQIASNANTQIAGLVSNNTNFERQLAAQEAIAAGQGRGQLLGSILGVGSQLGAAFIGAGGLGGSSGGGGQFVNSGGSGFGAETFRLLRGSA